MTTKILKHSLAASLLTSSLIFSGLVCAEGAVIVHPSNANAMTASDISRIFLGKKKTYPDGREAVPVDLKDGDTVRSDFVSSVLSKNDQQIKAYWAQLLFTGKGTPPKEVDSSAAVKELVSQNPSIIGYIDSQQVDSSVKVIYKF